MELVEKQALRERVEKLAKDFADEVAALAKSGASPEFHNAVSMTYKVAQTKLAGLVEFIDALDVETAEEYVATTLAEKAKARRKKPTSKHKHEQGKKR